MVGNPMNYFHALPRHIHLHDKNCTLSLQHLKTICLVISTQVCSSLSFQKNFHCSSIFCFNKGCYIAATTVTSLYLHKDLQLLRHGGEEDLYISHQHLQFLFNLQFSSLQQIHISIINSSSSIIPNFQLCFGASSISAYSISTSRVKVNLR